MGKIAKGLTGILASAVLAGCPINLDQDKPVDNKRHWADITYVVEGNEYVNQANNITYGRIDGSGGNWVKGFNTSTGSVPLNWSSGALNDCTGHYVRVGVSAWDSDDEARITLKIKDDGKVVASKTLEGPFFLDNLEYYITTQK